MAMSLWMLMRNPPHHHPQLHARVAARVLVQQAVWRQQQNMSRAQLVGQEEERRWKSLSWRTE